MSSTLIIGSIIGLIVFLLMAGMPGKLFRWIGQSLTKILIGAILLFFLNAIGNQFGLYVPINFATSAVSGFLGLPGVAALALIQMWVLV